MATETARPREHLVCSSDGERHPDGEREPHQSARNRPLAVEEQSNRDDPGAHHDRLRAGGELLEPIHMPGRYPGAPFVETTCEPLPTPKRGLRGTAYGIRLTV